MAFSSELLQKAVDQFSTLPGIGKKSALRMALFMLRQPKENVELFASSLVNLAQNVSQLHTFLYAETGYTPSDTVQQISAEIANTTGIY